MREKIFVKKKLDCFVQKSSFCFLQICVVCLGFASGSAVDRFLALKTMAWPIVRHAWDSCFSWFFKLDPLRIKEMRVLRLEGSDVS